MSEMSQKMNHIILFLILIPLTILSQIDRSCYYSSPEVVGYTLQNWFYSGPSWSTCEARCRADITCNTWMGRDSGGACYLSIETALKIIPVGCCSDHHAHLFIAATCKPTQSPTKRPTNKPTQSPTKGPTNNPTPAPTKNPTPAPTFNPTPAPTDIPTYSPTIAPIIAPTISPTTPPSVAPTLSPSIAPSISPSLVPSLAPSITPSLAPTIAPSSVPSLTPSIAPSMAPSLAPSLAPSIAPSLVPSLTPSITPSLAPSVAPTTPPSNVPSLAPSLNPSIAPSIVPSLTPSIAPSMAPSIAPSIIPSLAPSIAPSLAPSISPSIAPSIAPSVAPSISPSIAPSLAPSSSPTPTCHFAKFKGEMIVSKILNRNDILWGGESLVSKNCRYLLIMKRNGNLIVIGLIGKYNDPFEKDQYGNYLNNITNNNDIIMMNYGKWYNGWNTRTNIKNVSGEAVSKLMLENGAMIIYEEKFKNIPGFKPVEIWTSNSANIAANELILTLTNEACLVLDRHVKGRDLNMENSIWFKCFSFNPANDIFNTTNDENIVTEEVIDITTFERTFGTNDDDGFGAESKNIAKSLWWIWVLIVLLILILIFMTIGIKKYKDKNKATQSISFIVTNNVIHAFDSDEDSRMEGDIETTGQLDKWAMETLVTMETNTVTSMEINTNNETIEMETIDATKKEKNEINKKLQRGMTFNNNLVHGIVGDNTLMNDIVDQMMTDENVVSQSDDVQFNM